MNESEPKPKQERHSFSPVFTVEEAIERLSGATTGSRIVIRTGEKMDQTESISDEFKAAGMNVQIESWSSLTDRPGTIEYQVEVIG